MEIIVAMFQTIAKVLYLLLQSLLILGIMGTVMAIIGLSAVWYYHRKDRQLKDEKVATNEDDFEASYAWGPGKRLITSRQSGEMWRELDRLNDDQILENTKDLQ